MTFVSVDDQLPIAAPFDRTRTTAQNDDRGSARLIPIGMSAARGLCVSPPNGVLLRCAGARQRLGLKATARLPGGPAYDASGATREVEMPKYLLQVNYTLDGVKGVLSKGGSARRSAAQAAAESVGGTLESMYFAFGSTDVFAVADLPDNVAAAALALTVSGSGAATVTTVVLLTPEEIDTASQAGVQYTPPGQ